MGNSPELGHRAIWRTAVPTAADCLTCSTNQSSQFLHATHTANAVTRSSRFCTHVPLARTRLFCPVRSSALSQQHSRACCRTPVLAALLHSHVPLARTRLSCPVRSSALLQLHSRACRTHKALLPCTLPCALSCTHVPAARTGSLALCAPLRLLVDTRAGARAGDD